MKSIVRVSLVALLAALVAAPALGAEKAPAAKPAAPKAKAAPTAAPAPAPKPVLLFFLNPAGRPCQIQDQLLDESKAQWEPLAELRYVRTDLPSNRETFYRYGVRALPTLLLVDPDGKELRRFPPGIQQPATVLDGIRTSR